MRFEIIGKTKVIGVIAKGTSLRDRRRLTRLYGRGEWRKIKGGNCSPVRWYICDAEIHWYEAHGIGKKELKFKKTLHIR